MLNKKIVPPGAKREYVDICAARGQREYVDICAARDLMGICGYL